MQFSKYEVGGKSVEILQCAGEQEGCKFFKKCPKTTASPESIAGKALAAIFGRKSAVVNGLVQGGSSIIVCMKN